MPIRDTYPLFPVTDVRDSRDFFVRCFGMSVVLAASWVVVLGHRDDELIAVGLMSSDRPSQPPGPEVFEGTGSC